MNPRATLAACFVATLPTAAAIAGAQAPAVQMEVLLEASQAWNGLPYTSYPTGQPRLSMLRITIPPHTTLPWHVHPSPNAAYVVSGSLTVQSRDPERMQTFRAGDAVAESTGNVHRGFTGDEAAVLLVTYSGSEGLPLSMPVDIDAIRQE